MPLDQRARQVFQYFKKYNYDVAQTGDVIKFSGTYQASRGQAAALIFYVFCGKTWLYTFESTVNCFATGAVPLSCQAFALFRVPTSFADC